MVAVGAGIFIGRKFWPEGSSKTASPLIGKTVSANPGPWGELEYIPITIAAPVELLNVRGIVSMQTEWFFRGYTREKLESFVRGLGLSADHSGQLLDPARMQIRSNGIVLLPPAEVALKLPPAARETLYQVLAGFSENDTFREVVMDADLDGLFTGSRVTKETIARFRQLSCRHGQYLFCYCSPAMLASIPTYEEKADFLRGLTRQRTMLVRLHITANADINALNTYWGKACWSTDVKAILDSLAQTPNGAYLDVIELMPPLPTSLLYTYPVPENPLAGPIVKKDCHWTSFNFFRDPPDSRFNDPVYALEKLKTEYFPVQSDPRYGDLALFINPKGEIIHSAVFLADSIMFSKNGDNAVQPWKLTTINELLDVYSFNLPPGQNLTVAMYRNKYY